jgi:NADH-quinone oxidoreductase subunit L
MTAAAWICLASPLAAALTITLLGTLPSRRTTGYIATGSTFVSFIAALVAFVQLLDREGEDRRVVSTAWTWLSAGDFDVALNILVDPLSVMMMLIVSGVGSLIVGYSIDYMHGDEEERRYFAYMALFVFSMLLLVQSANFLMLLAGWGLVGLSSYLLIGYHQDRPSAIQAAKKAFIMNAFGDATMVLALFLIVQRASSLDYGEVFANVDALGNGWAVHLIALGLLGGAVAKSAQIPLQTWLPDAMEGPTPVSALIHAATMVTAGVYLIVRTHPIFEEASSIADLAAILGALTLLVAGLIALVQVDIKRVIAYSTMSQIGYMFLGAGLGAYASGMFHLMTHAFFKALLFLAAGIAMHALAGEQDIRKMRGLRGLLPRTAIAMTIGGLALAGIPPLAGFFSKDSIIASALAREDALGYALWAAGLAGAFFTGVYTFRMIFIVFGEREPPPEVRAVYDEHRHGRGEGPFWMVSTVAVLATLAVVGGWIQFAGLWHPLSDFLNGSVFVDREHLNLVEPSPNQDYVTAVLAVGLGATGIFLAWWIYGARRRAAPRVRWAQTTLEQKFFFDELYDRLFYRPAAGIAWLWYELFEKPLIAGSVTGAAGAVRQLGRGTTQAQTGYLRTYAIAIASGLAVLAIVFISVR